MTELKVDWTVRDAEMVADDPLSRRKRLVLIQCLVGLHFLRWILLTITHFVNLCRDCDSFSTKH